MAGGMHSSHRMVELVPQSLEKYMDVLAARQKVVASNIANVDTPGYKTQDVDFQAEFDKLVNSGGDSTAVQAEEVTGIRVKSDGNSVNLDREARLLSENSLRFNIVSNLAKDSIRVMKNAIHEGQGGS